MQIKIWTKTVDCGDGSSAVFMYSTEESAREGLDENDFEEGWDVPCEIDSMWFDTTGCEKRRNQK